MSDRLWTGIVVAMYVVSELRHAWSVRAWERAMTQSNREWFDYCRERIDGSTNRAVRAESK